MVDGPPLTGLTAAMAVFANMLGSSMNKPTEAITDENACSLNFTRALSIFLSAFFLHFHTKNGFTFCLCVSVSRHLHDISSKTCWVAGTTFMINLMFFLTFNHTFSFESNDRPCVCCVLAKWRVTVPLFLCRGFRVGHQALQSLFTGLVVNLRPHWYSIVKPISLVDVSGRAKNPLLFLWVFSRGMEVCEKGRCFVIRVVLRASRVVRQ